MIIKQVLCDQGRSSDCFHSQDVGDYSDLFQEEIEPDSLARIIDLTRKFGKATLAGDQILAKTYFEQIRKFIGENQVEGDDDE